MMRSRTRSPGRKQRRPVGPGGLPVHQVGVGLAGRRLQAGGVHARLGLVPALLDRVGQPASLGVGEERSDRALAEVVVVGLVLELVLDALGILVGPVAEEHDVVSVRLDQVTAARLDDQRAVDPLLLLVAHMAVVPVSAALQHREAVGEGLARLDAREFQAGHSVHVVGQDDAVPVHARHLGQFVADVDGDDVALAPAQHRPGHAAVDGVGPGRDAGLVNRSAGQGEVVRGGPRNGSFAWTRQGEG